jgi:uncharacterized protein
MPTLICSSCRRPFDPDRSVTLPFCSDRCRLVDLHHWLSEQYSLPAQAADAGSLDEESESA